MTAPLCLTSVCGVKWTCLWTCGFIIHFKLWLLLLNLGFSFGPLALSVDLACSQSECFCEKCSYPVLAYGLPLVPCNTKGFWRITPSIHDVSLVQYSGMTMHRCKSVIFLKTSLWTTEQLWLEAQFSIELSSPLSQTFSLVSGFSVTNASLSPFKGIWEKWSKRGSVLEYSGSPGVVRGSVAATIWNLLEMQIFDSRLRPTESETWV